MNLIFSLLGSWQKDQNIYKITTKNNNTDTIIIYKFLS